MELLIKGRDYALSIAPGVVGHCAIQGSHTLELSPIPERFTSLEADGKDRLVVNVHVHVVFIPLESVGEEFVGKVGAFLAEEERIIRLHVTIMLPIRAVVKSGRNEVPATRVVAIVSA